MASPAVLAVQGVPALPALPATALQTPLSSLAYPPFGALGPGGLAGGPLWFTLLLSQLPSETTTTTAKPATNPSSSIVLLPYPYPFPVPGPGPGSPPGSPSCNVNCPAVWEPLCSVNAAGFMYNFASQCALQAQNCASGSDFRFLYSGICRLKR